MYCCVLLGFATGLATLLLLNAVFGDHTYVPPGISTVEVNVVDCPEQMVALGAVITGSGVTVTVPLAGIEEQPLKV